MTVLLNANPLPLQTDEKGVIRVANTRLTLDSVITAFNSGATPENIVEQFPVIKLADVYTILGYYLNNQTELDKYLAVQKAKAEVNRQRIEADFDTVGLRETRQKRAETKNRSIEAELVEVVSQAVPTPDDQLSPELAGLVAQIPALEDVYLWRLAKSKFPKKDSRRIEFLHHKRSEGLIDTEKEELSLLMFRLEKFFLSRATAIEELGKRGQDVSVLLKKK
jgi:uncharacterized protein (DUF433 family)